MDHDPKQSFIDKLPERGRFGNAGCTATWMNKNDGLRRFDYVELANNRTYYLILDIDHPDSAPWWQDEDLPEPTINILNTDNGHSTYLYELTTPVTRPIKGGTMKVSQKPIEYFQNIRHGYILKLCADPDYPDKPFNCKNPLSPTWYTYWRPFTYSLDELADHLDNVPSSKQRREALRQRTPDDATSPASYLFKVGRGWAWRHVAYHSGYDSFLGALTDYLLERNLMEAVERFDKKLSPSNVNDRARRIAEYVWFRRDQRADYTKNRGVLGLEPVCHLLRDEAREKEIYERQALGGIYAAEKRREMSRESIIIAVQALEAQGRNVTVTAVVHLAGLGRTTVYRHRDLLP